MSFWATSSAALFFDKIGGGEWVAVTGLVVGLYGAANAANKYFSGEK